MPDSQIISLEMRRVLDDLRSSTQASLESACRYASACGAECDRRACSGCGGADAPNK